MEAKRQLTPEEEALRRNTDCIYFLASPLTCKKGIECEFRHSEVARLNPRECWYWLNSNCLNPKCGFRHPPLDGLFENPHPPTVQAGLYNNLNKQNTPCYYFQKGQCIKGDNCPFMHGFNPVINNPSQDATTNDPQDATKISSSLPSNSITNSRVLKECTTTQLTSTNKLENIPQKHSLSYPLDYELPKSRPISSDSTSSKPHHHHHSPPPKEELHNPNNGREPEEFLGESPGFDVLVDVDGEEYVPREPEFYNNEDNKYGGRSDLNLNPDYDYEALASYEKEEYRRQQLRHDWGSSRDDHHRSIENTHKRRSVQRDSSPVGDITGSDLRHNLLKKRRVNGHHSDPRDREVRHADYRYGDRNSSRRNAHLSQEISISPRLQGRIKLPPNRGRSPPPAARASEGRSRYRERTKHVSSVVERRFSKRDDVDPLSFPGPKSLAELKGAKVSGSSGNNGDGAEVLETSIAKKDAVEDEEVENFDTNDGDYEYEGNEGEDNAYEDEENACLEDEDEFEKKVKGFFS